MMNAETKESARTQRRRIAGQLEAIAGMVEADLHAVDLFRERGTMLPKVSVGPVSTPRATPRSCS